MVGWNRVSEYWKNTLDGRREAPLDPDVDFVTHISRATMDGEPLPDVDILDIMDTLTLGSLDTLKSQLGWCMYHLATHPEDRRRIVADPSLIPGAVEEFLRAYPIVSMARKLTQDYDFHGCPMKKDDMVLLSIQSATRDPRVFPEPEEVIIDRSPNRHIAFGASEHRCLGSHFARAELLYALEEWHAAIPEYEIASDEPLHGPRRPGLSPHAALGLERVKPAPFEYHVPATATEAVALLEDLGDGAKVIAGGQSLVPMLAMRLARFEHLVDIGRIGELQGVERQQRVAARPGHDP